MHRRTEPTPPSLLGALQTHMWFASCPAELQQALLERSRLWHLRSGETLFARDESADGLCCVVAGALRLGSVNPHDGTQRLTLYVEPYHWFGEAGLIDRLPRSMLAVADTDSTILVVNRQLIEGWLQEQPQYWRDIARLCCGKMRLMVAALEDNASLALSQRLVRRLVFSAANFGQYPQGNMRRRLRLPQEYLAQMLGVSRQTVNKVLRELERQHVLALHYAEIEILDMPQLLHLAGAIDPQLKAVFGAAGTHQG